MMIPISDETLPAVFSPDRRYRYLLRREILPSIGSQGGQVAFLMLNPSTADEVKNDSTVSRCKGFTKRWGYHRLVVVNLSPFRATDPADLYAAGPEPEDVWETNLAHIIETGMTSDRLVAAYGNHGAREQRAARVLTALKQAGVTVWCLERTSQGYPHHPRGMSNAVSLEVYQNV